MMGRRRVRVGTEYLPWGPSAARDPHGAASDHVAGLTIGAALCHILSDRQACGKAALGERHCRLIGRRRGSCPGTGLSRVGRSLSGGSCGSTRRVDGEPAGGRY